MCRTGGGDPLRRRSLGDVLGGHLDLDVLAFDVTERLTDMADAKARTERATGQALRYWRQLYGDDELLLSVPGMGPITASVIRGFLADGTAFASGKAAASYVGLNPSTWSSGTVSQPSRAITKEGPAVLRLAFFQAANAARGQDPQLAGFYHQLMTEHGHCHTQACVAVARKLWSARPTDIADDRRRTNDIDLDERRPIIEQRRNGPTAMPTTMNP
jgi:transposase